MPRPLRILYPHAWYHVMNRGAGRKIIFKNDSHRLMFLGLLKECHAMFNVNIYAYCLMSNHYHLLISTPDANLPRVMRHLNGVYTQRYNCSLKTDGPLFRGRYKAQLVDDDCYQLIVSRYIHLNPVEAGLVTDPAQYKWSSYSAYIGLSKAPSWLLIDSILNQLAETKALSHVKNYQDYVEEKCMDDINVYSGQKYSRPIIGSVAFKEKIISSIDVSTIESCSSDFKKIKIEPTIDTIIENICFFYNISKEQLVHSKRGKLNWPKLVCMYIAYKFFGHTLKDIAKSVGYLRYEAVSSAMAKCQFRMRQNPTLHDEIIAIVGRIRALEMGRS